MNDSSNTLYRPPSPAIWSVETVRDAALDAWSRLDEMCVLRQKGNRYVLRYSPEHGDQIVLKLWAGRGVKKRLAQLLRASSADREWTGLLTAARLGIRVPSPFGFARLDFPGGRRGSAIAMEDLGTPIPAPDYVAGLITSSDDPGLARFEAELIAMTAAMLDGNLLDDDHGTLNMVVSAAGTPIRLDLERARVVTSKRLRAGLHAAMLARLLATYAFAVHSQREAVERFANSMLTCLTPPPSVWADAKARVETVLGAQRIQTGIRLPS